MNGRYAYKDCDEREELQFVLWYYVVKVPQSQVS